ncbi:hypothetical protein JGU66_04720 [Myxococcaceae bacterium JPH2]|nr:hypothetical protein [Myxococcaceae bacterium JPH2]
MWKSLSWRVASALLLVCVWACNNGGDGGLESAEPEVAVLQSRLEDTCYDRSNTLLEELKQPGHERACLLDEDCPWGSHCDRAKGACDWTCLEAGPPGTECAGGAVCDCSGRCPGSTPVGVSTVLPRLSASPAYLQFQPPTSGGVWQAQPLQVTVRSVSLDGGTLPSTAQNAVVSIEAGQDMEVACGAPDQGAPFASECTLGAFTFSQRNGEYLGTQPIWTRPRTGVAASLGDGGVPDWEVVVTSESASNRRVRVVASVPEALGSTGTVREFSGNVTLEVGADDAQKVRLPVRGWADANSLFLFDESRTLSPSGRLKLGRTGSPKYVSAWLPLADGGTAGMTAEVAGFFEGNPLADVRLSGQFNVSLPVPVSGGGADSGAGLMARFTLLRVEGVVPQACPTVGSCATGYSCEAGLGSAGVCVAGTRPWETVTSATSASNAITHAKRKAWDDDGNARLDTLQSRWGLMPWQLAQGLVCNQGSAADPLEHAGFGASVLPLSGDLKCANNAPPYVSEFFTQRDRYAPNGEANPELFNSEELLTECLANLDALPTAMGTVTEEAWLTERLKSTRSLKTDPTFTQKTPARCLSLARLFGALHLSSRQANSRDQKLSWRLLQEWVGVHSFIAQEVVRQHDVADFVDGVTYRPDWPTLTSAMDRMERGWDLLLDSAYAPLLPGQDATRTCGMLNPDYRVPQKPVTSWTWQGASIATRGGNANWRRGDMTFVFDSADAYGSCPSSTTTYLGSLAYTADGALPGKRRLIPQCWQSSAGTASWGLQTAAKVGTSTNVWLWTGGTPLTAAQPALRMALRERDGVQTLTTGGTPPVPELRTFAYEHFLLKSTPGGSVSGPTTNRMGVWDYPLTDAELATVMAQPLDYLGPQSQDLAPHPQNRASHPQAIGFPVTLLEGLTAHLRLLVADMEQVERETVAACTPASPGARRDQELTRFGRTLRYALALEAFAAAARDRELAQCAPQGELMWTARWNSARSELARVRQQAYEKVRALNSCHPYGLPEDEAPLYFGAIIPSGAEDATAKFFGSSSYLLSRVEVEMQNTVRERGEARSAWLQLKTNQVQNLMSTEEHNRRVFELKREYGRPLVELCGFDSGQASEMLDRFDPVKAPLLFGEPARRAESCFVDTANPVCHVGTQALYDAVTQAQARFTLCTWSELLPFATLPGNQATAAAAYASADIQPCASGGGRCVRVGGVDVMPVSDLFVLPLNGQQMQDVPPGILGQAQNLCVTRLGAAAPLPTADSVGTGLDKSCYRGDMGAAMLGLLAARQSLAVARSSMNDYQEKFDLADAHCQSLAASQAERDLMETSHRERMTGLINAKSNADRNINGVETAGSMVTNAVGLGVAIYTGNVIQGVSAVAGLVSGIFGGAEKDRSLALEADIQREEQAYALAVQQWEGQVRLMECFDAAKLHLVGMRTAALQVERAVTDTQSALMTLQNLERTVRQRLGEGWAVVAQEEARQVPGFTHTFWLDQEILQARAAFTWAKRVAYLLALSLEYETQQSQGVRQQIAAASGPDQLTSALSLLDKVHLDQTLDGRLVEKHYYVLRLRDQLLGMKDRLSAPEGERAWDARTRLKHRLLAPESAIYDQKGSYLGQGVRFVMPHEPPGFPDRCAERMWGVAVFLSADNLSGGWNSLNPIPLRLRKRNTFQSHWCSAETSSDDFQTRAARPSLRLGSVGVNGVGEENQFTPADINAYLDDTHLADFKEGGSIAQSSFELKGRGLYGEYELIFPWKALLQNGFPLEKVNDVYLRFEVLSVAKN